MDTAQPLISPFKGDPDEISLLDKVASTSLDFLEALYKSRAAFAPTTLAGVRAFQLKRKLEEALMEADFALPGEIFARNSPYSEQKPRGSYTQKKAIYNTASVYIKYLKDNFLIDQIEAGDKILAPALIKTKLDNLSSALDQVHSYYSNNLVSEIFNLPQLETIQQVLHLGQRLPQAVRPDSADPSKVIFPRGDYSFLDFALDYIETTGVLPLLSSVQNAEGETPGIPKDGARLIESLIVELRNLHSLSEPRDSDYMAAPAECVRQIATLTDQIAQQPFRRPSEQDEKSESQAQTNSSLFDSEQAKALMALVDMSHKIVNSVQFDTFSSEAVMFPREYYKQIDLALREIDRTKADLVIFSAQRDEILLPGISPETARDLGDLIWEMRDIKLNATGRGEDFVAISQEDIDRISNLSENILYSGAYESLAKLAGKDEESFVLMKGKDTAAFATLQEALRSSSQFDRPERALGRNTKIRPEMTLSEWHSLRGAPNLPMISAGGVFIIKPGEGEFKDLQIPLFSGSFVDKKTKEAQEKAIRSFIRRRILDQTPLKGGKKTVGEHFRDIILKAKNSVIVAPTEAIAKACREESERISEELTRQQREKALLSYPRPERTPADFASHQVARFLRVVDAQGSCAPANLMKRGKDLLITHPDGPTITSLTGVSGNLTRHKDGHIIAKLPLEHLRGAVETGQPKVRVVVEEDRVASILGYKDPTIKTKTAQHQYTI